MQFYDFFAKIPNYDEYYTKKLTLFVYLQLLTNKQFFMELKDILAISGQPGLFKFIAQSSNGVIVEALSDGKRMNASASSKVSSMSEIAIFTESEDMPLAQVFENIFKHTEGKQTISSKSTPEQMKAMFKEILPDYDRERVHVSDMKKVISWFNILVESGMTEFKIEQAEEEEKKE